MDYLGRNPRDPMRETQYTIASGADRNPRSIRSIPETPGGTRGPDPLMNYTLRPEDMVEDRKLGEGSAGTVSKVRHVPTGFVMARKVYNISFPCLGLVWSVCDAFVRCGDQDMLPSFLTPTPSPTPTLSSPFILHPFV